MLREAGVLGTVGRFRCSAATTRRESDRYTNRALIRIGLHDNTPRKNKHALLAQRSSVQVDW